MAKKRGKPNGSTSAVDTCFVLMPFTGYINEYYGLIYKPAIEATKLRPTRADDLFRPSTIVNDIWTNVRNAKLLLADLTGKNANVFYELGLAHAIGKPVIMVAESMDDIPFDLRALRIILYDKNIPSWGAVLEQKITASIGEVLRAPAEAVLPTFLNVKSSGLRPSVTPQEKDLIEIRQELDAVRRQLPNQRPIIPPEEARSRIRAYLGAGMPESIIIDRLSELGAPTSWVTEQITEAKRDRRLQAAARARSNVAKRAVPRPASKSTAQKQSRRKATPQRK
jgi:hypothetical protein